MTSILVVDDDEPLCVAVSRDLTHRGYQVRTAHSVPQAIAQLESAAPDVLLADLRMPDRDGIDLLEATQHVAPRTRAILMSAFATARDYETAVRHGAVRVLTKPFTSDELASAIGHAVDCEQGFRGALHGLSLIDVLQMYHLARRSVTLVIGGAVLGSIDLSLGELVHAESAGLSGEAALRALLSRPFGSLSTQTAVPGRPTSIDRPFESLLLDVLREMDEHMNSPVMDDDFIIPMVRTIPPPASAANLDASAWASSVRDSLARIAPETSAARIDLGSGQTETLQGTPLTLDWVTFAREAGSLLDTLSPGWERMEYLVGGQGMALLRGPDGAVVALTHTLEGRYAQLRFRAVLGRLNAVVPQSATATRAVG